MSEQFEFEWVFLEDGVWVKFRQSINNELVDLYVNNKYDQSNIKLNTTIGHVHFPNQKWILDGQTITIMRRKVE
jgi:hypothetical protein